MKASLFEIFFSSKEDKKCGYVRRHLTFSDLSVFPESKMSEKKKIYFGKKMIFPDFFSHTWQTDKLIRCQLSQPHRGSTCHKVASDVLKILAALDYGCGSQEVVYNYLATFSWKTGCKSTKQRKLLMVLGISWLVLGSCQSQARWQLPWAWTWPTNSWINFVKESYTVESCMGHGWMDSSLSSAIS